MKNEEKEILYARWLNNELTDEEKQQLEQEGELAVLQKIVEEVDTWQLPEVRSTLDDVRKRRAQQKSKTKVVPLYRTLAAAAAVLLMITVIITMYRISFQSKEYRAMAGQTLQITLPDGTRADLNGNSYLSYNPSGWEEDRHVEISGQVYFDIDKKGPFEVRFESGTVRVLGTEFDVLTSSNYTKVVCYEGKVKTNINGAEAILTAGQGVDSDQAMYKVDDAEPSWMADYTRFKNAKLKEVLEALALRYNYEFDHAGIDINRTFTGQFINSNGEVALKMVFDPMGITYTVSNKKVTLK